MTSLNRSALSRPLLAVAAAVLLAVPTGSCATAQKTGESGTVQVVLRRIDVVQATYESMKLNVVFAVENGTNADVTVNAKASLAIVGEAKPEDADAPAEGIVAVAVEDAPAAEPAPAGERHTGTGSGRAAAFNTSELPVAIELPLPSDPAALEALLSWSNLDIDVLAELDVNGNAQRLDGKRQVAPPHLPGVVLQEAQVANVDNGAAGTGFFRLALDNKNPFAVTVDKLAWSISIKGKELRAAGEGEGDTVPASSVSAYEATVELNEAAFGKDLKALLKQPSVPYVIEGTILVRGITKPFKFEGEMRFAR